MTKKMKQFTKKQAKDFLRKLCANDKFGNQVYYECVGTLYNVGYPTCVGEYGNRTFSFINDYTEVSLTNHYKKVLRGYE